MAKKNKTNESKPIDKKSPTNHMILMGALAVGIVILLVLLFQNQATINEQRTTISTQQLQIAELTEENEKLKDVSAESILEDTGDLIIEKGTEILKEIISPN